MGKISCEACKKKCKKEAVKLEEKYYHVACFTCAKCKKQLKVDNFYTKDNAHYCPDDYHLLFVVNCSECGKPAEGNVINVRGETYHQDCFCCSKCGKRFEAGEKVTFNNKNRWCRSCQVDTDEARSPSKSPVNVVTPPKPPRAKDVNSSDLNNSGLSPTADRSGYSSSNGFSPEISTSVNLSSASPSFDRSQSAMSAKTTKSTGSLPRFGTPDNRFYNMSYLERGGGSDYRRSGATTPTPKEPSVKHFHRPDNFSYTSVRRDFAKPDKLRADRQEIVQNARRSDGGLAPIERDDWPGPPEPAAAYPEMFREKLVSGGGEVDGVVMRTGTPKSPVDDGRLSREMEHLSRMTDSGTAVVILRDLQKKRSTSPTLNPINASRTPSAAIEPMHKPRYDTPYFKSPSRDLDMLARHRSRSTDYSRPHSTPPSRNGLTGLKPGYGLKSMTPDLKNSYLDNGEMQPQRPQSSAAYLQTTPRVKTPTEPMDEFDATTGLRHSSHLRMSANYKYLRNDEPVKIYSYEELKQGKAKQLPGISPNSLERHLSPEEFEAVFKMAPIEFSRLPFWKQNEEKIRVGLN
jgi:actin-binding LIM protein